MELPPMSDQDRIRVVLKGREFRLSISDGVKLRNSMTQQINELQLPIADTINMHVTPLLQKQVQQLQSEMDLQLQEIQRLREENLRLITLNFGPPQGVPESQLNPNGKELDTTRQFS